MFKQRSIAERDDLDLRAFVLAGGDGTRLQSLTHKIDGDGRPKQFSKIFGGKSLLTHTRDRLRPIFSDDQVAFVVIRVTGGFTRTNLLTSTLHGLWHNHRIGEPASQLSRPCSNC